MSSWFGDEEAQRRREMDERRYRESQGGRPMARDDDRFDRGARSREDDYRRPYTGRSGSQRLGDDSYRPMTGDYGCRSGPEPLHPMEREYGRRDREQHRYDRGSSQRHPMAQREPRRRRAARPALSANGASARSSELDRDYDEYRRENQSRFESDFGDWREHPPGQAPDARHRSASIWRVVGNDEQHVGTVDRVRRRPHHPDQDRQPRRRSITRSRCGEIDRVEGDRVILDKPAEEARQRWRDESRDRALFEREDEGEPGPHILDRSFSGTY